MLIKINNMKPVEMLMILAILYLLFGGNNSARSMAIAEFGCDADSSKFKCNMSSGMRNSNASIECRKNSRNSGMGFACSINAGHEDDEESVKKSVSK